MTVLVEATTLYIITGTLTGLISGVLGIGGGIIVVPALLYLFKFNSLMPEAVMMHYAAGSSLAIMLITSQSTVRAHYKLGTIQWSIYNKLWPGIVIGTLLGVVLASLLNSHWLKVIFGLFLLFICYEMLISKPSQEKHQFPKSWINALVSFIIGFKSGLLGIGGGALIIPYLTYCGIDLRKIAPVSSLCTMTVALVGTLAVIVSGGFHTSVAYSTGYIYWPAVLGIATASSLSAPLGAKLTYRLPTYYLKLLFIAILAATALRILYQG